MPLAVDTNSFVVLLNGLAIPFLTIGPTGTLMLPATIPGDLPIGVTLYTQALLVNTGMLTGRLSPGIKMTITCGTDGPTFVAKQSTGSAATTGHYALAMAATIIRTRRPAACSSTAAATPARSSSPASAAR